MILNEKRPLLHYHENWWKIKDDCIWYLGGIDPSNATFAVAKWYFSDETQQLNGPYDSRQEAEEALKAYCEHL